MINVNANQHGIQSQYRHKNNKLLVLRILINDLKYKNEIRTECTGTYYFVPYLSP